MNSFGEIFRITLFGESHGTHIGVTIDGVPAGITLSESDFTTDLERRRGGMTTGTTPRSESDVPVIISGILEGYTTGAPVTILFENQNTRSKDYDKLISHPRPSHADMTARIKYNGFNDPRGGGMFSGRMTVGITAAGVIAKKIIPDVCFSSRMIQVGNCTQPEMFGKIIELALQDGDSVGGIVEVSAQGVEAGLGEPFFDSVESIASHLIFSIPGVKGIEFGAGFSSASQRGSSNNDAITDSDGTTATNNDGGINGGISNGNAIIVKAAFKPTPSIAKPQESYNFEKDEISTLIIEGRHDACIALRGMAVTEAALAIALADLHMRNATSKQA